MPRDHSALDKKLIGKTLKNGWKVIKKSDPARDGRFSFGYIVESAAGEPGFLKVLSYDYYFMDDDPAEVMQQAVTAYMDERRLLKLARTHNMDRIVKMHEDGVLREGDETPIQYLILEYAEDDARCQRDSTRRRGADFCMMLLHHAANGLRQLHEKKIVHQDLKDSNVLIFGDRECKLGDLGSAGDNQAQTLHMVDPDYNVAGDELLAPPELLYGYISPEWEIRRVSCDLYLLGSLIISVFQGAGLTPQIMQELDASHTPEQWNGSYESVRTYVEHAYETVIGKFKNDLEAEIRNSDFTDGLIEIVRELTHPDPAQRGSNSNEQRGLPRSDMQRYVSRLDFLSKLAAVKASAAG